MAMDETLTEWGVILTAQVTDPDVGNGLILEVEVRPVGTPHTGLPTAASGVLASGSTGRLTISGLTSGLAYEWYARTVDASGAASDWVRYTGVPAPPPSSGGDTGYGGGGGGGGGGCGGTIVAPTSMGTILVAVLALLAAMRRSRWA